MDKTSLKKHHFWILLSLAVVLVPVALGGAVFGVGKAVKEKQAAIDKKQKDLAGASPKAQSYIDALKVQTGELEQRRDKVWKLAYSAQAGLIHWPAVLSHLDNRSFGDPISDNDRETFRRNETYLEEYKALPEIIAPTQFAGGGADWWSVLHYVQGWNKLPSDEEAWLALEDLCVQRAVLEDLRAVNQMLAGFLPVPQPPDATPPEPPKPPAADAGEDVKAAYEESMKKYGEAKKTYDEAKKKYDEQKAQVDKELKDLFHPKDGEAYGRFISPYWQLDLAVARGAGRGGELEFRYKLTNVSPRRQNIAKIEFKVYLNDPARGPNVDAATLPVQAEYLESGKSFPDKQRDSLDFYTERKVGPSEPLLHVYKVEQKLDPRYAPVKRLERWER